MSPAPRTLMVLASSIAADDVTRSLSVVFVTSELSYLLESSSFFWVGPKMVKMTGKNISPWKSPKTTVKRKTWKKKENFQIVVIYCTRGFFHKCKAICDYFWSILPTSLLSSLVQRPVTKRFNPSPLVHDVIYERPHSLGLCNFFRPRTTFNKLNSLATRWDNQQLKFIF